METQTAPSAAARITHMTLAAALIVAAIVLLVLWQGRGLTLVSAFLLSIITFFFSAIAVGVVLSVLSPILLRRDGISR
jgi:hypothetical protein